MEASFSSRKAISTEHVIKALTPSVKIKKRLYMYETLCVNSKKISHCCRELSGRH